FFFFFSSRRRHTRSKRDWSSDVCSSDLQVALAFLFLFVLVQPLSTAAAFIGYSGAALAWLIRLALVREGQLHRSPLDLPILIYRSEERRVGKECRSWWWWFT